MPTLPSFGRRSSSRQNNSHRSSNEPPQPASYSNGHNQSTQRAPDSPVGWSPPSSQGPAYPQASHFQPGNSTQRSGSYSQHDNGGFSGGFRHQATLSVNNHPIAQTNSFSSSHSQHVSPPVVQDEASEWFFAIDQDGNGELSYAELHSALLNNNGGTLFSSNTVRYLVSIFDVDGDGVIRLDEFRPLWDYLRDWWRMFESFDTDRDGRIDATELGSALGHYRINVPSHILDRVVKKYSDPRRGRRPEMDLDQFVCACVVVRRMCDLYEKCSAGGRSNVSRDEFLLAVISLP